MTAALIVRDVTLLDGSGGAPRNGMTVTVADGRFVRIEPSAAAAPPDPQTCVIDGRGRYLVPGLWESHTHLRGRAPETRAAGLVRLDEILAAYARAGITTVLDLGGSSEIGGHVRARGAAPTGSAEFLFAGPQFTGIDGWPIPVHHRHDLVHEVDTPAKAIPLMRAVAQSGADCLKIMYDGEPGSPEKLSRETLAALIATAHEFGQKCLIHIHSANDIIDAVESGADGIEHSWLPEPGEDPATALRLADLMATHGTYFTPTIAIFEQLGRAGDRRYLDDLVADGILAAGEIDAHTGPESFWARPFPHHPGPETLVRYHACRAALPLMRAAGVKIAAGSDVAFFMPRPAGLHRELQLLARAGIPPDEVLVAATRHAAEKIGKGAPHGTIAAGGIADAVVLAADPLTDINHLTRSEFRVATLRAGALVTP